MKLWGVVPVLAVALQGHGMSGYLTVDRIAQAAPAIVRPANPMPANLTPPNPTPPNPTPGTLAQTTPSPVLEQIADGSWMVTVQVSGLGGTRCPSQPADAPDYTLETTSPATVLTAATATAVGNSSATPNSCEVTLTFDGLGGVPAEATLLLGGASPISLTVSRQITLFYYLAVPVIFGGAMALLLLPLCMIFVRIYEEDGRRKTRARKWKQPVSATGAWSINDSWATNIAALVAVVGTWLGVASVASQLFPGVDTGRFAILLDAAGVIVTAVPLLFAILYAYWTARSPGLTENASLWLTATLPQVTAVLPRGTRLTPTGSGRRAASPVRAVNEFSMDLDDSAKAVITGTSEITLARGVPDAMLIAGTVVTLPAGTRVSRAMKRQKKLKEPTRARLRSSTRVPLRAGTAVTPRAANLIELSAGRPAPAVPLPSATEVILPGDTLASLTAVTIAELSAGAAASISPATTVDSITYATLPDGVKGKLTEPTWVSCPDKRLKSLDPGTSVLLSVPADGHPVCTGVTGPHGAIAKIVSAPAGQLTLGSIACDKRADVWVPSGAAIALPWGASASASSVTSSCPQPASFGEGSTIEVPPGTHICILGGWITLPGTSDVFVQGDSLLEIQNEAGALAITDSGTPPADGQHKAALKFPVRLAIARGAKITVTGVAKIGLPGAVTVTAPRRKTFELSSERVPVRVPQGTNTIVGPLWAVILAALLTTFAVGVQLGTATVLVTHFSTANFRGLLTAWIISITAGFFILWYATTAIRALADPQPGSSMSGAAGTSFTL